MSVRSKKEVRRAWVIVALLLMVLGGILIFRRFQPILEKKEIDVPFTSQAPANNWSELWQNACEETSIYMVSRFYQQDEIKRDEAIAHIKEIFAIKNANLQVSKDESLQTISELINILELPWTSRVVKNPSVDDLKIELANNRPVIVPVYAPALRSATYQGGGADYHVLVLTGYDDETGEFIVNDPGTKQGEGIRFPYQTFMDAIHDLNATDYEAGKKAVLFTEDRNWWNTLL